MRGDGLGDGDVRGREIEVIGQQEASRADYGGSGGGMRGDVADIGTEAVEALAADLFQAAARVAAGSFAVEVGRELPRASRFLHRLCKQRRRRRAWMNRRGG